MINNGNYAKPPKTPIYPKLLNLKKINSNYTKQNKLNNKLNLNNKFD